jgi:hypothetical protein
MRANSLVESLRLIINNRGQGGTTSKQALGFEIMEEEFDYSAKALSLRCEGYTTRN